MAKDFDFSNYKKCSLDDIIDYLKANDDKEHKDYRKVVKQNVNDGEGYLKIKRDFYEKFFPEYIPVKKHRITMKDKVKDL